jgi:hypothetical protein
MKVNFFTSQPKAAASMFYLQAFERSPHIQILDHDIGKYDILLLMTYDHEYIQPIKQNVKGVKIGLIDPRGSNVENAARHADFLVVDSIEMEDFWSFVGKPMFRFVEYPVINERRVTHIQKKKIKIGYHGNLIHLLCSSKTVKPALENLSERYDIEFMVMHAFSPEKGVDIWQPQNVPISHIPWSMEGYEKLASCDIGLVPNNLLLQENAHLTTSRNEKYNYNNDDYILRFKMSSNPGRIVVFGRLGIPTVCEIYPSSVEFAGNSYDERALLAHGKAGWERQIERLICSADLRNKLAGNMQKFLKNVTPENQNKNFLAFMKNL